MEDFSIIFDEMKNKNLGNMSSTYAGFDETRSRTALMGSRSLSNNNHSLLKKNAMISKLELLREHNNSSMRMPP